MAGRILNRRELRKQADEAAQLEAVAADPATAVVAVPKKAAAVPRVKKPRKVKAPPRQRVRWGIFDSAMKQVAIFDYNQQEVARQRGLYEGGVTSKQSYDYAVQAFENSKADLDAAKSAVVTQERQLAYYDLTAPFNGVVGDVPVHIGDYVSPQTLLTTVDENADLEAYIYIPTERASDIRMGLPVQIVTSSGEPIEKTKVDFISPQVDNALQGVLVKAPVHAPLDRFRNAQLVKARVVWSTSPAPTVPVLAVTRIGGQPFVYVADSSGNGSVAKQRAVVLGDTVGNDYAVNAGLKPGDKVIVSGIQFLVDGEPVQPIS